MLIRDALIFLAIVPLLPVCFARPYVGILMWSWVGYMNPHRLTWGPAYNFSFAQYIALFTLAGVGWMVLRGQMPKLAWTRETWLVVLLWLMFVVTTFFSLRPDLAWPELVEISKILLMTFLTISLVDSRGKLRVLLLLIALSIGFFGFKGGIFALVTGGQYMVLGPPGSFIEDNTAIGIALTMAIPLLFYLGRCEKNRFFKRFLQLTFALSTLAAMFTYSRGAFLGLTAVAFFLFLELKLRQKIAVGVLAALSVPVVFSVLPDAWVGRVQTIQTYEEDGSAQGRLLAWETAWKIAVGRPLVGGGFQIVDDSDIARAYNPEFTEAGAGVHSVYFELLAENGFITFGIFVALLGATIMSLRALRKRATAAGDEEIYCYATGVQVSLFAYIVTGFFLEFASFDLFYHLVAIAVVLKRLGCATEIKPIVADQVESGRGIVAELLGKRRHAA